MEPNRRTVLQGCGALFTTSLLSNTAKNQPNSTKERHHINGDMGPFSIHIPSNDENPVITPTRSSHVLEGVFGWEDADYELAKSEILRTSPDLFDELILSGFHGPPIDTGFGYGTAIVGQFCTRYDIPQTQGVHGHIFADDLYESWYKRLPEEEKWSHPDGTTVEHPSELVGENFYGDEWVMEDGIRYNPSPFAPGTLDRLVRTGSQLFQIGINQFWFDAPQTHRHGGNDFSEWALSEFTHHLESLSDERLEELGIQDPSSFDIKEYLANNGLEPYETDDPAVDPVYREFTLFQHKGAKSFHEELFDTVRQDLPSELESAGTEVVALQWTENLRPIDVYVSDSLDSISIESNPTVPPYYPNDIAVKIGRVLGRFEKPVRHNQPMTEAFDTTQGLDPDKTYPTLLQLQAAQTYANGGRPNIEVTALGGHSAEQMVNNWMETDGSIDDDLQNFLDFVRARERFLTDVEEGMNNVAMVLSLPTTLWRRAPGWDQYIPEHAEEFREVAAILRREHIPYDVIVLDYPALWEASEELERLKTYEHLILPDITCISDPHLRAIEDAVELDTTVIVTGGIPTRSENYEPRDDVDELSQSDGVIVIDEEVRDDGTGEGDSELHATLSSLDKQVQLDVDGDVMVNMFENSGRVVIHLVNFDYDEESDSTTVRENLEITVNDLPFPPETVYYFTPRSENELEPSINADSMSIEVPELNVWGIIVVSEETSNIEPSNSKSDAEALLEEAQQAIDSAEEDGRTELLEKAIADLETAKNVLELGAFDRAKDLAQQAVEWEKKAYKQPIIGIDQAHNQPQSEYPSDLSPLKEEFDEYQYTLLDEWDEESINSTDILLIPPVGAETGVDFDISDEDIHLLESFVEAGGCLVFAGQSGMQSGYYEMSEHFGVEFDHRPIIAEPGDIWECDIVSVLSSITQFRPRWVRQFTVPVTVSDGETLAYVAPDQNAWLHESDPVEEQSSDEEDATQLPVMAGKSYGRGLIVAVGTTELFTNPETVNGRPEPLVDNIFWSLGEHARNQRRSESTTDGEDEADSQDNESTNEESEGADPDSVPGFGIVGAITAMTGVAYLLKYLKRDDE